MKKVLILIVAVVLAYLGAKAFSSTALLQECPDEKIVNKMPVIEPGDDSNEYYIVDGARREVGEYDAAWVEANCQVPVQEVF